MAGAGVHPYLSASDFTEHDFETTGSKRAQQEQRENIYTSAPVPCLFPDFDVVRSVVDIIY